jgi:hypothetical protein
LVPFYIYRRLQNLPLLVLQDNPIAARPELGQHPVLVVGQFHLSLKKDETDLRGHERQGPRGDDQQLLDRVAVDVVVGVRASGTN